MRSLSIIILSVFFIQTAKSQIYEFGVFVGANNFIGDVGSTKYIAPNKAALGLIAKWNRSPRHSFRASVIFAELEGIDTKSDDARRKQRGYEFTNSIIEISAGMEFTFLDFDLHTVGVKGTPYLYSGITATKYDNYFFTPSGVQTSEDKSSWAFGIPMVIGYKTNISEHLILAGEVGARYTFSDELDGNTPSDNALQEFSFGNTNSNDWYMFTGFTLTYTFGRRPCYCNF